MESLKLRRFMHQIKRAKMAKGDPVQAAIELTYVCNHNCIYCYNAKEAGKKEMAYAQVCSIIDQLVDMGVLKVSLTGGEIFTRPDIMDIIRYAREKGLLVLLMTNGSLITERIANKLINWGITEFDISFPGARKETFDKITQVEGSFDKVISAVRILRKKGIRLRIKTCANKVNINEVEEIMMLARELGATFDFCPFIIPAKGSQTLLPECYIEPGEYLNLRERIRSCRAKRDKDNAFLEEKPFLRDSAHPVRARRERAAFWERERVFDCLVGRTTCIINPYGEIKPCILLREPSYDIKKIGLSKAWNRLKEFVNNLKPPPDWQCYSCEYNNWCSRCPGTAYSNTGDIFGCPQFFKDKARLLKERNEAKETLPYDKK